MKRNIKIILLVVVLTQNMFAQNNLIDNNSFEESSTSQVCDAQSLDYGGIGAGETWISAYNQNQDYWNLIPGWTQAAQKWSCFDIVGTPDIYCNNSAFPARSGSRAIKSGGEDEYLFAELNSNMNTSHYYYYEFYHRAIDGHPHKWTGMRFFNGRPEQCDDEMNGEDFHESQARANFLDGHLTWTRAHGFYKPDQNYNIMGLGPWNDDFVAVLFDDVKLIDVGPNMCPEYWYFDNMTFNHGPESFQASNKIIIGNGADPNTPYHGDVTIESGSFLTLRAPNELVIKPGFHAEEGVEFEMQIGGCIDQPCEAPSFIVDGHSACGRGQQSIYPISNDNEGWIVSWSPAQYFVDPSVTNPIFMPPPGSGVIDFNVSVTNMCGVNYSQTIPVQYSDEDDANHTIENIYEGVEMYSFDVVTNGAPSQVIITIDDIGFAQTYNIDPKESNVLHWENPASPLWNTCGVYDIDVKVINSCTAAQSFQTLTWDRNGNYSGIDFDYETDVYWQVIKNDPQLDHVLAYVKGADEFEIWIYNKWGNFKAYNSGKVTDYPQKMIKPSNSWSAAPYVWIINFTNCHGAVMTYQKGWIQLSGESSKMSEDAEKVLLGSISTVDENLIIYPNPAQDNIRVEGLSSDQVVSVVLTDIAGNEIFRQEGVTAQNEIDVSYLSNAIYLLRVVDQNGGFRMSKLVIRK